MIVWNQFGSNCPWHNPVSILKFSWRDQKKLRKASVRITNMPAEIRTEPLSITNIELYRYANPLCAFGIDEYS
jgi:hypothetical protein